MIRASESHCYTSSASSSHLNFFSSSRPPRHRNSHWSKLIWSVRQTRNLPDPSTCDGGERWQRCGNFSICRVFRCCFFRSIVTFNAISSTSSTPFAVFCRVRFSHPSRSRAPDTYGTWQHVLAKCRQLVLTLRHCQIPAKKKSGAPSLTVKAFLVIAPRAFPPRRWPSTLQCFFISRPCGCGTEAQLLPRCK